jgi:hypothetical protein
LREEGSKSREVKREGKRGKGRKGGEDRDGDREREAKTT